VGHRFARLRGGNDLVVRTMFAIYSATIASGIVAAFVVAFGSS
jgi:hypothetical protein